MMTAVFWTLAAVAVTASHRADPGRTFRALRTARGSFLSSSAWEARPSLPR